MCGFFRRCIQNINVYMHKCVSSVRLLAQQQPKRANNHEFLTNMQL